MPNLPRYLVRRRFTGARRARLKALMNRAARFLNYEAQFDGTINQMFQRSEMVDLFDLWQTMAYNLNRRVGDGVELEGIKTDWTPQTVVRLV